MSPLTVPEAGSLRSWSLHDQVLMGTLTGLGTLPSFCCVLLWPGGRARESQLSGVPSCKASDPIRPQPHLHALV